MKELVLSGKNGECRILIGASFDDLAGQMPETKGAIITDEKVFELYGHRFPDLPVIRIGRGEKVKRLKTVEQILRSLVDCGIDRYGFLYGIGGGIVCDITGFTASIYLRGVRFSFVPTTLLAQVDAAIGGKNGVNLDRYKNMIGVFNQPEKVIIDPLFLKTLPAEELASGMAEVIKHALIADSNLFRFLEDSGKGILKTDSTIILRMLEDSVRIKVNVVGRDEMEKGERKKLNFGHTIGHAIEKVYGISHGKAVSIGMYVAAGLSKTKGLISKEDLERIKDLLLSFDLPTDFSFSSSKITEALFKDKKREDDNIHFVLLKEIGKAFVEKIPIYSLEKELEGLED